MRVENDSDYYYDILNINDRLHEMIIEKHKSIYNAYKILGRRGHNLYEFVSSLEMLHHICSKLDINFGYCLTGENQFDNYDLQKLVKVYESCRYKKKKPNGTSAIISMIRHGKKNIKIATLLKISTLLKKKIPELI
jgi:hypothetical protein